MWHISYLPAEVCFIVTVTYLAFQCQYIIRHPFYWLHKQRLGTRHFPVGVVWHQAWPPVKGCLSFPNCVGQQTCRLEEWSPVQMVKCLISLFVTGVKTNSHIASFKNQPPSQIWLIYLFNKKLASKWWHCMKPQSTFFTLLLLFFFRFWTCHWTCSVNLPTSSTIHVT